MTAFVSQEEECADYRLALQIKSLNSRYLDLKVSLPQEYQVFEQEIQKELSQHFQRGRIHLDVRKESFQTAQGPELNNDLFKQYWDTFSTAIKQNSTADFDPSNLAALIVNHTNVLSTQSSKAIENLETEKKALFNCLSSCIKELTADRAREGAYLRGEIEKSLALLKKSYQQLVKINKDLQPEIYQKLSQKVASLLDELKFTSERIEQEVVHRVDRHDITEELVRIEAHLELFEDLCASELRGKKIEFLSQELLREFNTIAAKAFTAKIQTLVVDSKIEIEKIREQSFNLE